MGISFILRLSLYRRTTSFLPNLSLPLHITRAHHHLTNTRPFQTRRHFLSFYYSRFRKTFSSSSSKVENMGVLRWYFGLLESRPIITKSISASIIYAAADITSQMITMSPSDSLDTMRTLRMAGFGILIVGPAQHAWFNFVARILPKRDTITTLKKLSMGQILYGPCLNGSFFSFNAALQGENRNEIMARLKRDLLPTWISGLMFWPICDFLTYKVIPVHLQPLVNSSFSYIWTIYLTYMASLKKAGID